MPKRIGYLRQRVLTIENCTEAVLVGTKNLEKTRDIQDMREHPQEWGQLILDILTEGWVPQPTRTKVINEGTGGKVRHLRIPTRLDHLIHVAIMLPIMPILERKFDFYCCGSVKNRGQKRVNDAIKGWMGTPRPPKYGGEADVHHAYEETRGQYVMISLRSIIKDEAYLAWHRQILDQMGGTLAIGFQPSHWYFNLLMTQVDRAIRQRCHHIKMVRYMDNYLFLSNRKRMIHRAIRILQDQLSRVGLTINRNYQVYPTAKRMPTLLSYRYGHGYTILRKDTMHVISARLKTAGKKPCAHNARSAMSRIGVLRHCNSYNFRKKHTYAVLSVTRMKEVVSHADKRCTLHRKARKNYNQPHWRNVHVPC